MIAAALMNLGFAGGGTAAVRHRSIVVIDWFGRLW